jgi:hypothetical protein
MENKSDSAKMNNAAASEAYSDEAFYSYFKTIRNKLRKFDTTSIVGACLRYLHAPYKEQFDYLERHPWLVLLLIKWALVDEQAFLSKRRAPTDRQLIDLLNLMRDLGSQRTARMPSEYDDVRLFLRAMAYQQISLYQRKVSFSAIARQLLYFGDAPADGYIRTTFAHHTGIEIHLFLELSQALLARFYDGNEKVVTEHWFSTLLNGAYSKQEITAFLNTLSKSLEQAREALLDRDRDNMAKGRKARSASEYWEQTAFVNYPLLKSGFNYVCVDHQVLFACLEHYIYNRLRANNAKLFMAHFGPLFEKYVEKAIAETGLPFVSETKIKQALGEESSAIDFLIADDDSNIFVDAKAAEMSYQGKSTHLSTELARSLETSALKAIKQAHAVLATLPQSEDPKLVMRQRGKNYLITVTYSELYVGSGRSLAACIGEEKIRALLGEEPASLHIPLENMYAMTIQEFELLAEAIRTKKITLTKALDHAISDDTIPQTAKFEFRQHLASANITLAEPAHLVSRAQLELEALADRLRGNAG